MKKELQPRFMLLSSVITFVVASILILIDRFWDWHISGLLFFTMIYIVSFIVILCLIFKKRTFRFGPYAVVFLIYFYLSVYYIFVPACTVGKFGGILRFLVVNIGFIVLALLELGVAVGIPELLVGETNIKLLRNIIMCVSIVLVITSIVVLIFPAREMLIWAFQDEYVEVVPNIGSEFMTNLMRFIFEK